MASERALDVTDTRRAIVAQDGTGSVGVFATRGILQGPSLYFLPLEGKQMNLERLKQLHEAARYAKSHGSGFVTIPADELLEVLPAEPVDVTQAPSEPSVSQNETPRELITAEAHAEAVATKEAEEAAAAAEAEKAKEAAQPPVEEAAAEPTPEVPAEVK